MRMDAHQETYDERMERERLEARALRDETREAVYGHPSCCMSERYIGLETKHRRMKPVDND